MPQRPSFGNPHNLLDLGTFSSAWERMHSTRADELRAAMERTKYFEAEESRVSLKALLAKNAMLSRAMDHYTRIAAGHPPPDPEKCGCVLCRKPKTAWQWILDPAV